MKRITNRLKTTFLGLVGSRAADPVDPFQAIESLLVMPQVLGYLPPRNVDFPRDEFYRQDDNAFRAMERVIAETVGSEWAPEYLNSPEGRKHCEDLAHRRYAFFAQHVVPWVNRVYPIKGKTVLEVGSGAGCSTLAFAQLAGSMKCYDLDQTANEAARQRLAVMGYSNARVVGEAFEATKHPEPVDIVLLCAVLEHMLIEERLKVLKDAWQVLRPGGIIVVAETPNRLAFDDWHTSFLPFFDSLPIELREAYAQFSPRAELHEEISKAAPEKRREVIYRWGVGVCYHEFELALGKDVHSWFLATGHEPEIMALDPARPEDQLLPLAFYFKKLDKNVAFTRSSLYFIVQKPLAV